jgi:Probable Zinc-ribbon domain
MELLDTLIEEWHPKNEKPFNAYTHGSQYRAWWLCPVCKHEWQTAVHNRIDRKSKCPNCKKLRFRGNTNPRWTGYGEISGRQWGCIQKEATEKRRNKFHTALPFEITIEYAWELFLKQNRKCALSGEPLTMWGKIENKLSGNASLDRIDSSKGYLIGNVQWIDKKLQHIKTKLADNEFIAICQKVAAYQIEKLGIPSFKKWASKG